MNDQILNDDQLDALTEMINISIGVAANSLGEIVETRVVLNVPSVKVFPLSDRDRMDAALTSESKYATVKQDFQGNLSGTAVLAFPPESAGQLVSLLTDIEYDEEDLDIMQAGTLLEIGNIINNAFLGTLNNQFNFHVTYSLPEFNEVQIASIVDATFQNDKQGMIILANTNFLVKAKDIEGHILLLFRVADVEYLKQKLNEMLMG